MQRLHRGFWRHPKQGRRQPRKPADHWLFRISSVPGQEEWSGPISRVLSRASIYLGLRLPAASCGQPGAHAASGQHRSPKGLAPYWALLRAGFCQPVCHHTAGGLLPHHFTLARLTAGGMFLCHFPSSRPAWVLPSALPYGARTFLPRLRGSERLAHSSTILAHPGTPRACSQSPVESRYRRRERQDAGHATST